jgi:hypothetical protein
MEPATFRLLAYFLSGLLYRFPLEWGRFPVMNSAGKEPFAPLYVTIGTETVSEVLWYEKLMPDARMPEIMTLITDTWLTPVERGSHSETS